MLYIETGDDDTEVEYAGMEGLYKLIFKYEVSWHSQVGLGGVRHNRHNCERTHAYHIFMQQPSCTLPKPQPLLSPSSIANVVTTISTGARGSHGRQSHVCGYRRCVRANGVSKEKRPHDQLRAGQ